MRADNESEAGTWEWPSGLEIAWPYATGSLAASRNAAHIPVVVDRLSVQVNLRLPSRSVPAPVPDARDVPVLPAS